MRATADSLSQDDEGAGADPVRIYLRNLKVVPLLTREREVELAKRIEDGGRQMWQAALTTNLAIESLGTLCRRLQREEVTPADVFGAFKNDDEGQSFARPGLQASPGLATEHLNRLRGNLRKCSAEGNKSARSAAGGRRVGEALRREIVELLLAMRIRPEHLESIVADVKGLLCRLDDARRGGSRGADGGGASARTLSRRALAAAGIGEQALRAIVARIDKGERQAMQAKEAMVAANLRLVVAIANRHVHSGLDLLDLVQEGNIGLMKAVDKFDYRLGYKFATYATWWIRQSIERAVSDQSRTIRIPVHVNEAMNKLRHVRLHLLRRLGREATSEEIATELGVTVEKLDRLVGASKVPISLDTPITPDGDRRVGDLVMDDTVVPALEGILANEVVAQAHRLLASLTPREERVLRMRFGIRERDEHTLEQVGNVFGVTRERIRQIEANALAKLRRVPRRG